AECVAVRRCADVFHERGAHGLDRLLGQGVWTRTRVIRHHHQLEVLRGNAGEGNKKRQHNYRDECSLRAGVRQGWTANVNVSKDDVRDTPKLSVLVFSTDPLAAALMGAAVELAGYTVVFPFDSEAP